MKSSCYAYFHTWSSGARGETHLHILQILKGRIFDRESVRNQENSGVGVWGVWAGGAICIVNLKQWAQHRRKIILPQFGLLTFEFHFEKTHRFNFHDYRTGWTCPRLPKPNMFMFGDTK